jgi:hypothetical protein
MSVSPHLHRKLREKLGVDAGDDLAGQLNSVDALRADVAELRHEMQLGFARIDSVLAEFRGQLEATRSSMEARLEKALREQMRFFFLAWSVLLAAIVGLYAR